MRQRGTQEENTGNNRDKRKYNSYNCTSKVMFLKPDDSVLLSDAQCSRLIFSYIYSIQSRYKILATFPLLCLTASNLFIFIFSSLYLLVLFIHFAPLCNPLPSGDHWFLLCIFQSISVLLYLLICYIF